MTPRERFAYLAIGAILLFGAGRAGMAALKKPAPIVFETNADKTDTGEVVVHVAGAVKTPGVYKFTDSNARVQDAIARAGGGTADADINALNLAARLIDGSQILVPTSESVEPVGSGLSGPIKLELEPSWGYSKAPPKSRSAKPPKVASTKAAAQVKPKPEATGSVLVSLNAATIAQLDTLPGIGPATAQKIIDYRKQHGGFSSVDQLIEVKGIGEKKLAKLRPFVRL